MAIREQRRSRGENAAIKEWLAKGNKITKCPPGAKSEPGEVGFDFTIAISLIYRLIMQK